MEKLSGKTALVTGSTDGVGGLVARKLGQAGARVLVHGRDAERGARVVAEIEGSGGTASFLETLHSNISSRGNVCAVERAPSSVRRRAHATHRNSGRIFCW